MFNIRIEKPTVILTQSELRFKFRTLTNAKLSLEFTHLDTELYQKPEVK